MTPCLSQLTILSSPFAADFDHAARAGFPSVELWITKLETALEATSLDEVRALIDGSGVRPAAAAGQGGLLLARGEERSVLWEQFRCRLRLLQSLEVPILVLAADAAPGFHSEDYGTIVAALREAGALAKEQGVRLALEFQRGSRCCASLDTAVALVEQAGGPDAGLGVCLDVFHYYTGPSKFEDLALVRRENLAWVQVCDLVGAPREVATDSDRILPGDGDFQLRPILEHLRGLGYDGGVALEVPNPQLWTVPADRVSGLGFQALGRVLAAS